MNARAGLLCAALAGCAPVAPADGGVGDARAAAWRACAGVQSAAGLVCTEYPFALRGPRAVVVTRAGAVLVAESGAGRVAALGPDGPMTVIDALAQPFGLAEGPRGELYVSEAGAGRVTRVAPGGARTLLASGLADARGVAFGADRAVYVSTAGAVRRIALGALPAVVTTAAPGLAHPTAIIARADGTLAVVRADVSDVVREPGGAVLFAAAGVTALADDGAGGLYVGQSDGAVMHTNASGASEVLRNRAAITALGRSGDALLVVADDGTARRISGF